MSESNKGICRLSLVPMRSDASDETSVVSQILFGEHYSILEESDTWIKIQLYFDDSEGWIRKDQNEYITLEYFDQINNSDYKVCTELIGNIYFKKKHVNILIGSVLPISTNELFKIEEQVAFNGSSKSLSQKREFEFFKETVSKYLSAPYLLGGKSPFGIDEGGLVQQVFKICGYKLGRSLNVQVNQGKAIKSLDELEPGDVIYKGIDFPIGAFIMTKNNTFIGVYDGQVQSVNFDYLQQEVLTIRRHIHSK
ncbi:MAG: hypothetical protein ACJA2S_000662 [Cyclobacteriaceae bacterium]|jgi:hypothetical protein